MKFDVSHDFLVVASVLLLACLFNRTIVDIMDKYEMFVSASQVKAELRPLAPPNFGTWWQRVGAGFWVPNVFDVLVVIAGFVWLVVAVIKQHGAGLPPLSVAA